MADPEYHDLPEGVTGEVLDSKLAQAHTQNTDTSLDLGGTNPITAAELVTLKDTTVPSKKVFHGIETAGAVTWDQTGAARTITLTGPVTYWYQGTKFTTLVDVVCDLLDEYPAGLTANNLYYIAFEDATGELKASQSMNLKTKCPVCMVFWNGTDAAVTMEKHNYTRDLDWHLNAHRTIGTRYYSGLAITSPNGAGNEDVLNIGAGYLYDEDILHTLENAKMTDLSRIFHRVSADVFTFVNSTLPYAGTIGAPKFLDTDTYTLETFAANNYACYWVYGTGDKDRPIYIYPTHAASAYGTITAARAEAVPNITGVVANSLNPEMKLLYRFIYKGNGDYQEVVDYRLSSPLPAGGTAPQTAAGTTFSPAGSISSTNVQSAIEELDNEKLAAAYGTIYVDAGAMVPCTTNPAEAGTKEYGTNDIDTDYFAFDGGATEERVQFKLVMPEDYDLNTVKAKFYWISATGSTAGDTVEWGIKAGAITDDGAIDAAMGTAVTVSDTLLADAGADLQISAATAAMTIGGTPALGKLIMFEVYRNTDGTDNMTEDAQLLGVAIQYGQIATAMAAW